MIGIKQRIDKVPPRTVYCSISAQEDNLGDIEIRSIFVGWLTAEGGATTIFLGSMSAEYVAAFQLPENVRVIRSRWAFQLAFIADAFRRRASLAFAPGPQSFNMTRNGIGKTAINLVNATLVRCSGGVVIGAGRALRGNDPIGRTLERLFIRRFNIYAVRDDVSALQLGMKVEECPDLAFACSADASSVKDKLLISLRSDREVNLTLLSKVIDIATAAGLRVEFITQVRRDDDQHRDLAEHFGTSATLWEGRTHLEQFQRLRGRYADASLVVSNRLHALILGVQHLAHPVAMIDSGVDKLSATIPSWIDMGVLHTTEDEADAFENALARADSERGRLAQQRNLAQKSLQRLRRRIQNAIRQEHHA